MVSDLQLLAPILIPFSGVLGLIVGSFLNVVIYRVPLGLSVIKPASACPACDASVRPRDNVPVVSWLLLGRKCRDCSSPISARYPLVEAFTGILFAVITWWSIEHAPTYLPLYLYLSAIAVALFLIDIDVFRLPDEIVLPSYPIIAALTVGGYLAAPPATTPWTTIAFSALGWLTVIGLPWLLTLGKGMGFGDVKLAPLLGACLGAYSASSAVVGLAAAFILGALISVAMLKFANGGRRIAFGPYLLAGTFVGLFFGKPVADWYLSFILI
jgi:leader peptidase (prepilin peptidase) / N-methyltransferase